MSLHDQSAAPRRTGTGALAVALVVGMSFTSGCAHFAENLSALCTTVPPTYCEDAPPPADFGYYCTHWDRWPCNELTIDRGHRPEEKQGKKITETDTTTTDDTTGTQNEMDDTGVPGRKEDPDALPDDLFSPETNQPVPNKTPEETPEKTPEEPGLQPPDPNAPDEMPGDKIPEVAPPGGAPDIPDDLFDDKKPATPPGQTSWDLEPLPTDAPEGSLVSDRPESKRPNATPGKATNVEAPRLKQAPDGPQIETARRKEPVRRTSAIETLPTVETLPSVDDNDEPDEADSNLELEGPELQVPATVRLPAFPPKSAPARPVVKPALRWPSDELQLVAPRLSESKLDAERSARTAVQQRLQSKRAAPTSRATITDSPKLEATP